MLIWLYRRHPDRYRRARTTLAVTTATALAGFWLFPTAPPRLLAAGGYPAGFQDIMAHYSAWGWWAAQDSAPRGLASLANQFAAMPSLHFAWALWCGISLARYASGPAPRLLGALYPLATAIVILGTANHYLLDVLGAGAIVLAADTTTRAKLLNHRIRCLLTHQPGTDRYRPEGLQIAAPKGRAPQPDQTTSGARFGVSPALPRRRRVRWVGQDRCSATGSARWPRTQTATSALGHPMR